MSHVRSLLPLFPTLYLAWRLYTSSCDPGATVLAVLFGIALGLMIMTQISTPKWREMP